MNLLRLLLIITISLTLTSCFLDDNDIVTINGRVERAINGNGIANQSVILITRDRNGSGLFAVTKDLDQTSVVTDENGNFSVNLVDGDFVSIIHQGDENYSGSGILRDYQINEKIIIESNKFVKFKVIVKNTNPIDENDFIEISFFGGINVSSPRRTNIENFGIVTPELLNWKDTAWTGTDVNTAVYYSVEETADDFKIFWKKKKNGLETSGFTNDIPHNIDQINTYTFEY